MSRIDIVIFGATGYTGKYAVVEMVRLGVKYPEVSWAVAGRSMQKLKDMLAETSKKMGKDLSHVKVITADTADEKSLKDMCTQAKVLANCVGPFCLCGEAVIRAAIDCKTHYVDIAAEPPFLESMELYYNKLASDAGVYVISACGFDSVPNDMGVLYMQRHFGGVLNTAESYITNIISPEYMNDIKKYGLVHRTSWDSLLYSMMLRSELKTIRKKLFSNPLPKLKPELPERSIHKRHGVYAAPFVAPDDSIVYRTQRRLFEDSKQRPVQFHAYHCMNFLVTVVIIIGVALLEFFSSFSLTRKWLMRRPGFFTLGLISEVGPSIEAMEHTTTEIEMTGEGWDQGTSLEDKPDKRMVLKIKTVDPYRTSVLTLNLAAITILKDMLKMPGTGGVMTTGIAFKDTEYVNRLQENNITFQIVEIKNI